MYLFLCEKRTADSAFFKNSSELKKCHITFQMNHDCVKQFFRVKVLLHS